MNNMKKLLAKAIALASMAHVNQFDRGGQPYILHPLWVMNRVRRLGHEPMVVAILHDVVEDTHWTISQLREEGYPERILSALELLDFRGKNYMTQIKLLSYSPIARAVKLADIEHNIKPTRLKGLSKRDHERIEKYHTAFIYLNDV